MFNKYQEPILNKTLHESSLSHLLYPQHILVHDHCIKQKCDVEESYHTHYIRTL